MPATEIEAYEDDTRLHFVAESDFPRFLDSVLQITEQISQTKVDEEIVEQHIVVVDQTVRASYTQVYPETAVRILTPMKKKPQIISHQRSVMLINPAAMFSLNSRVSHYNFMGMTQRVPLLQKKITTLLSNQFLQIKGIQQSAMCWMLLTL